LLDSLLQENLESRNRGKGVKEAGLDDV